MKKNNASHCPDLFRILRLTFIFILILFVPHLPLFAEDSGRFSQRLEWIDDEYAFEYKVELRGVATSTLEEGLTSGSGVLRGTASGIQSFTTEDNFIDVTLSAGNYEYRVIAYDFLGKEAAVSEWRRFSVIRARTPVVGDLTQNVVVSESESVTFDVPLDVSSITEETHVELVNSQTHEIIAGRLDISVEAGQIVASNAVFPEVPEGTWRARITNPSGLSTETPEIVVTKTVHEAIELAETHEELVFVETPAQRAAEERRLAEEAAAAAEQLRLEEEVRLAEEARAAEAECLRLEEEARLAEAARQAEENRLAEERRLAEEAAAAEQLRLEEEARLAEEAAAEAERLRIEEELRLAEARRLEEEQRLAQEAAAEAERLRQEEEARLAEEQRLEQERLIEQMRLELQQRLEEDHRMAEQEWAEEEARRTALRQAEAQAAVNEINQEVALRAEEVAVAQEALEIAREAAVAYENEPVNTVAVQEVQLAEQTVAITERRQELAEESSQYAALVAETAARNREVAEQLLEAEQNQDEEKIAALRLEKAEADDQAAIALIRFEENKELREKEEKQLEKEQFSIEKKLKRLHYVPVNFNILLGGLGMYSPYNKVLFSYTEWPIVPAPELKLSLLPVKIKEDLFGFGIKLNATDLFCENELMSVHIPVANGILDFEYHKKLVAEKLYLNIFAGGGLTVLGNYIHYKEDSLRENPKVTYYGQPCIDAGIGIYWLPAKHFAFEAGASFTHIFISDMPTGIAQGYILVGLRL